MAVAAQFRIADKPGPTPFVDTRAFLGTKPTGAPITSGLRVTWTNRDLATRQCRYAESSGQSSPGRSRS